LCKHTIKKNSELSMGGFTPNLPLGMPVDTITSTSFRLTAEI